MAIKLPQNANFENLESWNPGGGGMVPVGIYEARIVEVEVQKDNNGFPKLNMKHEITQGEHTGGTVYGNRSLSPKALNFFRGYCEMLSVSFRGMAFNEQGFVGRCLRIHVEEYPKQDGSTGTRVGRVYPSEIAQNDPIDITVNSDNVEFSEEPKAVGGFEGSPDDDNVPF